jgi:hypothetical protein
LIPLVREFVPDWERALRRWQQKNAARREPGRKSLDMLDCS